MSALQYPPSDLIAGEWAPIGGDAVESRDPAEWSRIVWSGSPALAHIDDAVAAARRALPEWSGWGAERRFMVLRRFAELCTQRVEEIALLISEETGKALWDARGEASILAGKVNITLDPDGPLRRVTGFDVAASDTRTGRCTFRPHGVMAVVGPFNFPAHLPNGHIVPALAMGNTVVFKPSDKAPAVGQLLAELFDEVLREHGAPAGVINLVQGAGDVASRLVAHDGIDGVLFTGSWAVGRRILEANLDHPGRIIALEMGGNNAAVVMPDADLRQAAIECVRCAFITTGQRCTCTRRVVVHEAVAERFIGAVCKAASNLVVAHPRGGHPVFMGPLIDPHARDMALGAQANFARTGEVLLESTVVEGVGEGGFISPGVVRVERFTPTSGAGAGCDAEVFGPLLRVTTVPDLNAAIEQANATRFGLAASIFTRDAHAAERFRREARAGCLNVNTGTAGAISALPFGGLGLSGNHRPAGAFSLDYCAAPIAGLIETGDAAGISPGMTFDDNWIA